MGAPHVLLVRYLQGAELPPIPARPAIRIEGACMGYLYELAITPYVMAKKHYGRGAGIGKAGPEQRIPFGAHRQQRFSYWEPERVQHAPVVLYFHGGGFVFGESESMADAAALYNALGYRFCSIGFREAPLGKFPAQVDDAFEGAKVAVSWLESKGVDCSRLIVGGTSAGGMLAYLVCYSRALQRQYGFEHLAQCIIGCVSIAGVSDACDLIVKPFPCYAAWRTCVRVPCAGRSREAMRRALDGYSPVQVVSGVRPDNDGVPKVPAFIMHGRADTLAPFKSQVRFVDALRWAIGAENVEFCVLEPWRWQHMMLTVSLHKRDPETFLPLHRLFDWLTAREENVDAGGVSGD